jgi:hypothetical protein
MYTERDNASIADPYQRVAVDVMDARETQELTLTVRPKTKERKNARNCLWRSLKAIAVLLVSGGVLHGFCRRVIN